MMAIFSFSLGPDSISKLHDALVCLGKFSDSVSFDASHDQVCDIDVDDDLQS
jgi:cell cycle checkpoint control protein RAD9A